MMNKADKTIADVVICGAGICGISAAYHLAVKQGIEKVAVIDEREPMTFTSDKSTECYRNWWPGPGDTMVRFMNRSIDLLEELALESNNYFGLNRRGYVFLTGREEKAREYERTARAISVLGAGPLRIHRGKPGDPAYYPAPAEGFQGQPTGADLVLDPALIQQTYPFITPHAKAMLHPRRCGWLSAQQLGMYLLEQAKAHGVELVKGRVTGVDLEKGRVVRVQVGANGETSEVHTRHFVIASGPFLPKTGAMIGVDLPVINELHAKIAFSDPQGVIPRHVPLMIWEDPVELLWSDEEREDLAGDRDMRWLLEQFPAGVHFRPEGVHGSPIVIALWTYDLHPQEPVPQPEFDPLYTEIVMRGLARMVPGLETYIGRMYSPVVDGGYYCKTSENRPLIGPLPVEGAYVFGAVSGYGIMSSMAGGELLAKQVAGSDLPDYAPAVLLSRYDDPAYQALLAEMDGVSGQL